MESRMESRMRLIEIAEKLDCLLEGEGEIEISGVASLEQARPGDLTFLSNPKYTPLLKTTEASAVL
ncbi:MAG: UDP-3-O-(3-hydroxymyristoyl)glucosamine N-acyltransferase, partial [Acidobacteria bacterium]|nr:UDP-3-O-(3-hydroxymyristoyl)glucosamine N-acyltransferase [Acidobacteriota bacterium]